MARTQPPAAALVGASGLLFAGCAATTVAWCRSMPAMAMPMPGGWTMSMAWMRLPDQTWPNAVASFATMWTVMMVAMMLPALLPALRRYAEAVAATGGPPVGPLVVLAGAGYFTVWSAVGVAVFPAGVALAAVQMTEPAVSRAVPMAIGAILLGAGALQFTKAKARALACCRAATGHDGPPAAGVRAAWRHGLRLGVQCLRCCSNLMVILLVLGVMDLAVMAAVTVAITAERVAPGGDRVARIVGAAILLAGVVQLARAVTSA